jgi:hypothetical protein
MLVLTFRTPIDYHEVLGNHKTINCLYGLLVKIPFIKEVKTFVLRGPELDPETGNFNLKE